MKQIRLFATLLMVALMATSCITWVEEDDINNGNGNSNGNGNGSNNLKTGQIEMKVYPDTNNRLSFSATTNKITIDWGDGYIDKLTPNGVSQTFSHIYANQNLHTIYIESEKLVRFTTSVSISFKELYFGEMKELIEINCGSSQLTILEIKKATALTSLNCRSHQLTSLDVRGCPALKELDCVNNQITSLNVSGLTALITLQCGGNQLTSLNVSGLTALTKLTCGGNQLTSLNVSGLTALTYLDCFRNQLTSNSLNSLFESLPNGLENDWNIIYINTNPGTNECNRAIAENKGWKVNY